MTLRASVRDRQNRSVPDIPIVWHTEAGDSLGSGSETRIVVRDTGSFVIVATAQFKEAFIPDGTVYLVLGDGRLAAVQGSAPLDSDAPWPIWRRDNRRTASVPRP